MMCLVAAEKTDMTDVGSKMVQKMAAEKAVHYATMHLHPTLCMGMSNN